MKNIKVVLAAILAIVSLVVGQVISQTIILFLNKIHMWYGLSVTIGAVLYMFISYYLIKLLAQKLLHTSMSEIGVKKFHLNIIWIIVAILLPVLVIGTFVICGGHFIKFTTADTENIVFNILYGSIAAGFVEELIFRGLILSIFIKKWNYWVGILLPSIIFASLHVISRQLSIISFIQLLIGGTLAGIMFSLVELSFRSFWNDALMHAIWNLLTSAIISVNIVRQKDAILTFIPNNKAFWFTGGDFGMESSMVAIAAYLIVILIAVRIIKEKQNFEY